MAIYIDKALVDVASDMSITVEASKLGPRQHSAYIRMARTGFIKGYSSPALMAEAARKQAKLPYVRCGRYYHLSWGNMAGQTAFFTALRSAATGMYLDEARHTYYRDHATKLMEIADEGADTCRTWGIKDELFIVLGKSHSFTPLTNVPETLTFDPRDHA